MLKHLKMSNVGPSPKMEMELAPRLNLIAGDNGLGKSFLLDLAWWALTRRWLREVNTKMLSGYPVKPRNTKEKATLEFSLSAKTKSAVRYESTYNPRDEAWAGKAGRPWNPGLVIYAHSDGGFSVWDPARNYWKKKGNVDVQERLPAYVFTASEVWDGLWVDEDGQRRTPICNGLLYDWASWIREKGKEADAMERALRQLSPPTDDSSQLRPGPLMRLSVNDARDIPSIQTSYADAVPILHASSGIRRVVAFAYMMTWTWKEHRLAAEQLGEEATTQVTLLVDEVESHLHPRWQRVILRSLMELAAVLHHQAQVQLLVATHSPMVMASVESWFDEEQDALFHLKLRERQVLLEQMPWSKQGDVVNWLVSDLFGLEQGRSLEAEKAIEAAEAWMRGERSALPNGLDSQDTIHQELLRVLAGHDHFWPRWIVSTQKGRLT